MVAWLHSAEISVGAPTLTPLAFGLLAASVITGYACFRALDAPALASCEAKFKIKTKIVVDSRKL
jgi:hypothetical protein